MEKSNRDLARRHRYIAKQRCTKAILGMDRDELVKAYLALYKTLPKDHWEDKTLRRYIARKCGEEVCEAVHRSTAIRSTYRAS